MLRNRMRWNLAHALLEEWLAEIILIKITPISQFLATSLFSLNQSCCYHVCYIHTWFRLWVSTYGLTAALDMEESVFWKASVRLKCRLML